MEEDVTLASIKDMLKKYSSKKSLFTDSSILNRIEDSRSRIQESVENKSGGLISLLKMCSEEIRLLKVQNNRIEATECVECLVVLNKIKKDIEGIKKENVSFKSRLWVCRVVLVPVLSVLIGVFVGRVMR